MMLSHGNLTLICIRRTHNRRWSAKKVVLSSLARVSRWSSRIFTCLNFKRLNFNLQNCFLFFITTLYGGHSPKLDQRNSWILLPKREELCRKLSVFILWSFTAFRTFHIKRRERIKGSKICCGKCASCSEAGVVDWVQTIRWGWGVR